MNSISFKKFILMNALFLGCALTSYLWIDQSFTQMVTTTKHPWMYRPVRELTELAEAKYHFLICLVMLAAGFLLKKNSLKEWGKFGLFSYLLAGICLQIFKHIFGRQRPHASENFESNIFHPFTMDWHFHSMPSGHAQTAFTMVTLLCLAFPKHSWKFIVLGTALALTRVPLGQHFLSDVILGCLVGMTSTVLLAIKMKKIKFHE